MAGHFHFWIATILATCPVCPAEMLVWPTGSLSNLRGITHQSIWNVLDVPRTHPQTVPGTLPRHTAHQIPLCVLCLSACILPARAPHSSSSSSSSISLPPFSTLKDISTVCPNGVTNREYYFRISFHARSRYTYR